MIHLLQNLISPEQILENRAGDFRLYGNGARYTVYPRSEMEISRILTLAHEHRWKVTVEGNGTKRGLGGTEEEPADLCLSLSRLCGIREHSTGDMIATVLPGTTFGGLSKELGKQGQTVPFDAYWPERATIGGIIAANDSGPKRCRFGSARDHIIGLRIVKPDGTIVRTGGKVVKNVAGYDMNKLFIGSMGTLGVITEVTMKLRPVPPYAALSIIHAGEENWDEWLAFIRILLDSQLEPVTLELCNPALCNRLTGQSSLCLLIAFEDVKSAVDDQLDWIARRIPPCATLVNIVGDDANEWWSRFYRLPPSASGFDVENKSATVSLKIGSKNRQVPDVLRFADRLGERHRLSVLAHGGGAHGITRVYLQGESGDLIRYIRDMRSFTQESGGYTLIQHAPLEIRRELEVWGEKPPYFPLLAGIKKAMDARSILNDKRFLGGL